MDPFLAFMAWCGACWLYIALRHAPLQPEQPCDDLADVDLEDVHRRRDLAEAAWMDRPVINIRLSQRWTR